TRDAIGHDHDHGRIGAWPHRATPVDGLTDPATFLDDGGCSGPRTEEVAVVPVDEADRRDQEPRVAVVERGPDLAQPSETAVGGQLAAYDEVRAIAVTTEKERKPVD